MKNALTTNTSESAPNKRDYSPGAFPKRHGTVQAAVLAALLKQNTLTGMDSVFKQHTTRLGAIVHALSKQYGWHIERHDVATGTSDGRIAWISAYWLPQATIAKAFQMGAHTWIGEVHTARAKLRRQASDCKAAAMRINARRQLRNQDPRQSNLWGGEQ